MYPLLYCWSKKIASFSRPMIVRLKKRLETSTVEHKFLLQIFIREFVLKKVKMIKMSNVIITH